MKKLFAIIMTAMAVMSLPLMCNAQSLLVYFDTVVLTDNREVSRESTLQQVVKEAKKETETFGVASITTVTPPVTTDTTSAQAVQSVSDLKSLVSRKPIWF